MQATRHHGMATAASGRGIIMAEYIEREATIKLLRSLGSRDYRREKGTIQEAIKMVSFPEYTPSADVAPVRHGRWVDKQLIKSFKHTNIPVVECSACGIDFCDIINNHYFMYKYCPNCGAKMDG